MRKINVSLTTKMVIEVPDDFPISDSEFKKTFDYKLNDYSDGRFPLNTEIFFMGARGAIQSNIEDVIRNYLFKKRPDNSHEGVVQRTKDTERLCEQAHLCLDDEVYIKVKSEK